MIRGWRGLRPRFYLIRQQLNSDTATVLMLPTIERWIEEFILGMEDPDSALYNEASLQHELALFLRGRLPQQWKLFIERPASASSANAKGLAKKEIDLAIRDTANDRVIAIEMKCPRRGQHPEQMFKACQDLQFLEELVATGFSGGIFLMHVRDPLFYGRGSIAGIYSHFRAGTPISGTVRKPTGARDQVVNLRGAYAPTWAVAPGDHRYWLQSIAPAA